MRIGVNLLHYRVANCLKRGSKKLCNEWFTNDRSWINFKVEFRSVYPQNVDIRIFYLSWWKLTDNFPSYPVWRLLLRLNIVKELSDDPKICYRDISTPSYNVVNWWHLYPCIRSTKQILIVSAILFLFRIYLILDSQTRVLIVVMSVIRDLTVRRDKNGIL